MSRAAFASSNTARRLPHEGLLLTAALVYCRPAPTLPSPQHYCRTGWPLRVILAAFVQMERMFARTREDPTSAAFTLRQRTRAEAVLLVLDPRLAGRPRRVAVCT